MKHYKIRFNTDSKTPFDKWRLIEDGQEILVAQIIINGVAQTSEDWVFPPIENQSSVKAVKKWHISCEGDCKIINNVAHINTSGHSDNSILRHILKTISYRMVGTLTTFSVSYIFTRSIGLASTLGITELMIKPVLYFLHERVWYKFVKFKK
jgi:uncharacterized membrane protein